MASFGTPYEGRDNIIGPAIYISGSLDLRLYTNTPGSLSASTVLANLTYPTGTGYAHYTMSGSFAFSNGQVTYDDGTPDNVQFTNSGASSWTGDVAGVAMTDGTYILHFKDLSGGAIEMTAGRVLEIDISTLTGS